MRRALIVLALLLPIAARAGDVLIVSRTPIPAQDVEVQVLASGAWINVAVNGYEERPEWKVYVINIWPKNGKIPLEHRVRTMIAGSWSGYSVPTACLLEDE